MSVDLTHGGTRVSRSAAAIASPQATARRVRAGAGWASWLVWVSAGIAGVVAWSLLRASAHAPASEPLCLLRRIAHVPCPTCGMTRALARLAAGEWRAALALHPWSAAIAAQVVAGWLLGGLTLARGSGRLGMLARRLAGLERWLPHLVALNLAALILIWLVRLATGTLPPI